MTEATLLALGSAVLHASWNLLVKTSNDRFLAAWGQFLVGGLLLVPLLPFVGVPGVSALPYLVASSLVHVGYIGALVRAYHHGDFSLAYPLARGGGALLAAVGGVAFLGDSLSGLEWLAIAVVVGGLASLVRPSRVPGRAPLGGSDGRHHRHVHDARHRRRPPLQRVRVRHLPDARCRARRERRGGRPRAGPGVRRLAAHELAAQRARWSVRHDGVLHGAGRRASGAGRLRRRAPRVLRRDRRGRGVAPAPRAAGSRRGWSRRRWWPPGSPSWWCGAENQLGSRSPRSRGTSRRALALLP